MEKLLELLNEYEKELNTGLYWRIDEKYGMLWRGLNLMGVDQYLISKHYGFIKWLVDNDKIEINKLREESFNIGLSLSSNFRKNKNGGLKNYYECKLLMLLAIQDAPIEFLISILK